MDIDSKEELIQQLRIQIKMSRRLYQLCSLLSSHLSKYEDIERFDNTLMDILKESSESIAHDPTQLI